MNRIQLSATIGLIRPLRHTPSGVPVLEMQLQHQSQVEENGAPREIQAQFTAKLIGQEALKWVDATGRQVDIEGFLSNRNWRNPSAIIHINHIMPMRDDN